MTDEEMEDSTAVYYYGFGRGRDYERKQIVAWFLKHGKRQVADDIEAKEHLK
jgi:hypothetical protein